MNNIKGQTKFLLAGFLVSGSLLLSGCAAPLILAGAGAGIVGANVAGNKAGTKTQLSDTQIKFRAVGFQADYPALQNNSNVEIAVYNGIVLLLGQVPNEKIKEGLAAKISNLPDVSVVYNQLVVGKSVSLGQYADDGWITSRIVADLNANGVGSFKFKVITESGVVYMMGVVTKEEGYNASVIASEVKGVKKVVQFYSYLSEPSENNVDGKAI